MKTRHTLANCATKRKAKKEVKKKNICSLKAVKAKQSTQHNQKKS